MFNEKDVIVIFCVPRPTVVNIAYVRMVLPVDYGDEDMPEDFPLRDGDTWDATVDLETGRILNFPEDYPEFDLHMKVCDGGVYKLHDASHVVLATIEDYVPSLIPNEYGDYVTLKIAGGVITNWKKPNKSKIMQFFGKAE